MRVRDQPIPFPGAVPMRRPRSVPELLPVASRTFFEPHYHIEERLHADVRHVWLKEGSYVRTIGRFGSGVANPPEGTRKNYNITSEEFDEASNHQEHGLTPAPDCSVALRQAGVHQAAALKQYMGVLRILTDLLVARKIPGGLSAGIRFRLSVHSAMVDGGFIRSLGVQWWLGGNIVKVAR